MKKVVAFITKKNGSFVASIKNVLEKQDNKSVIEISNHFVSNKCIKGSIGTVVDLLKPVKDKDTNLIIEAGAYQIQGYEDKCYLISTFTDKSSLFKVDRKDVKHRITTFIKENRFYLGELIEKPTVKGTRLYFNIIKELPKTPKARGKSKLEQKKPVEVSEV